MRIRYRDDGAVSEEVATEPWLEIVGVVTDLVTETQSPLNADNPAMPQIYHPLGSGPARGAPLYLAAHVRGNLGSLEPDLRRIAREVSPALQLQGIQSLAEASSGDTRAWKLIGSIVLLATVIALALSLAGIYAVMSGSPGVIHDLRGEPSGKLPAAGCG